MWLQYSKLMTSDYHYISDLERLTGWKQISYNTIVQ